MELIAAIDLLDGKAVRLLRGSYDDVTVYSDDPATLAAEWRGLAGRLHVVDLEGARAGRAVQRQLVERMAKAFGPGLQVGGGVRSLEAVESYLELGAERVVMGTVAIKEPELLRQAATRFPDRIVVALDARDGFVATEGWLEGSDRQVLDVVRELEAVPLGAVLYTDIARDGTEVGPNVEATSRLACATRLPVIASGGVGTLEHLRALARAPGPIAAAVVGRALHERRFSLADAARAAESPSL